MKLIKTKSKSGFTMVEMVIAIAVICLLAIVLLVQMSSQAQKANEAGLEVDYHSYYIAAKAAILSDQGDDLTTQADFVEKLNSFLDPGMHIQNNLVYSDQDDPWNSPYEIRWRSREIDGRTEYWVAFLSKGVGAREGWIFEPEKPGDTMYSRDGIETGDYRYIMVLGYYAGGVQIQEVKDPTPDDDDDDKNDTIEWLLDSDIPDPVPGTPEEAWAYLTFGVEMDGIEFDGTQLDPDNDTINSISDDDKSSLGSSGYMYQTTGSGYASYTSSEGGAYKGSYVYMTKIGGDYDPSSVSVPVGTVSHNMYDNISGDLPDEVVTDEDIEKWLGSYGYTHTVEEDTSTGTYVIYINLGYGNMIQIQFNASDKREDSTWFKVGSTIKLKAIPGSNYNFEYWKVDGEKYSEEAEIEIMVEADTNFTAKFRADLTVSNGELYTADGSNLTEYVEAQEAAKDGIISDTTASYWGYTVTDGVATLNSYSGPTGSSVNLVLPTSIDGYDVEAFDNLGNVDSHLTGVNFDKVIIPAGVSINTSIIQGDSTVNELIISDGAVIGDIDGVIASDKTGVNSTGYAIGTVTVGNNVTAAGAITYGYNVDKMIIGDNFTTSDYSNVYSTIQELIIGENFNTSVSSEGLGRYTYIYSLTLGSELTSGCMSSYTEGVITDITIKSVVKSVSEYQFQDFTALQSIVYEGSLDSIGKYAFDGCTALTNFEVKGTIGSIGDRAFQDCSAWTLNTSKVNLSACTSIGQYAFYGIAGIEGDLVLPESAAIGSYAFQEVTFSDDIIIGADSTINSYAFKDSEITGTVSIGSGSTINNYAFSKSALNETPYTKLVIGDSVIIGTQPFAYNNISEVEIGDNADMSSATKAFYAATIDKIVIGSNVSFYNISSTSAASSYGAFGSAEIGILSMNSNPVGYMYYSVKSIDKVVFDDDVTEIGQYSFSSVDGLASVTIGENVTTIARNAFNGCTELTELYLGESLSSLGSAAFTGCTALEEIKINQAEGDVTYFTTVYFKNVPAVTNSNIIYLK